MLYGEKTVPLKSRRIPESKKDEIEGKIDLLLLGYHNLKVVEIDCEESDQSKPKDIALQKPIEATINKSSWKDKVSADVEKKLNPTDIVYSETTAKSYEGKKENKLLVDEVGQYAKPKSKFTPNATKNDVNIDALRAIANGKGVKSELFATKKKPIDEIYDCIAVTRGIPDISERIYASAKSQIAFWDRDDNTVFYVSWENKYYRFVNSAEFNKFLKDNQIK